MTLQRRTLVFVLLLLFSHGFITDELKAETQVENNTSQTNISKLLEQFAQKGINAKRNKNYQQAIEYFSAGLDLAREGPDRELTGGFLWQLTQLHLMLTESSKAVRTLNEFIQINPIHIKAYKLRAQLYRQQETTRGQAIADYRRILELKPNDSDVWGALGWLLILEGQFSEGQNATEKAVVLAPGNYAWAVNLGHAWLLRGDDEQARKYYRRTLLLVPDAASFTQGPLADFNLFIQKGWEPEKSLRERIWMKEYWQRHGQNIQAYHQALEFKVQGQMKQAAELAQKALPVYLEWLDKDEPHRAYLLNEFAVIYFSAGRYIEAEPLYREALTIRQKALPEGHSAIALSLSNLALLLNTTGRYGEAEPLLREALEIFRQVLPEGHALIATSLINLAGLLDTTGRFDEAELLYREALTIRQKALPEGHPDIAQSLNNLAFLLLTTGRYGEAEPLFREALAIRIKALTEGHPDIAQGLNNLAALLYVTGRYGEAEPFYRKALAIYRRALPEGHPDIAQGLNNLALLLKITDRYGEAEPLYREALAIYRKVLPEGHSTIATSMSNLASLLESTGHYGKAELLYREALAIKRKALPEGHADIATSMNNLAGLLETTGRYGESEPLYREALAIYQRALSEGHATIATSLINLASLLETTGHYGEVEELYREALVIRRKALPEGHADIAAGLSNLAGLFKTTGRYGEAEPLYREALIIYRRALPEGHTDIALSLSNLASLLETTGHYGESEPLYHKALAIYRKILPEGHATIATSMSNLGGLFVTTGRYGKAEPLFREALAMKRKALPEGHVGIAASLNNLALLLRITGRYGESEPLLREALGIKRRALPEGHADIATGLNSLASLLLSVGRYSEAEPLFREALVIKRKALSERHPDFALGVNNLAALFRVTGRYGEAEPLYREALAIHRKALPEGHATIASSLNNLAVLLDITGRYGEAELYYQEALTIKRKALPKGHTDIARGLNNLGGVLQTTGRYHEAEQLYREALAIRRKALPEGHVDIAQGLNNLASLFDTTGRYGEAESLYREALVIYQRALPEGHPDIALSLSNLADLLQATGRYGEAEPLLHEAYRIVELAGEPNLQWTVQGNLQYLYQAKAQSALAIFYGKQAVNTLQKIRRTNLGLEREAKQAFLKSIEGYYKNLADLLIDEGRLSEAQQVLAMLKEEELHQFLRRSSVPGTIEQQASYNNQEKPWAMRYQQIQTKLATIGAELRQLKQKKKYDSLSKEEETRYKQLKSDRKVATQAFDHYLDELYTFFTHQGGERSAEFGEKQLKTASLKKLQHQLGKLGEGAIVLHYLVTDERVRILLTSPSIQIHRDSAINESELNELIFEFSERLKTPSADPRPLAQKLYRHLIGPIEKDLETLGARVLMVSLDGALRYIPLAALHDGQQWLTERYGIVMYTAAAADSLTAKHRENWTVAGLGVSQGGGGLSPLPAVRQELDEIVRRQDDPEDQGVLSGVQLLDDQFTSDRLSELLEDGYPVVHLASHFIFNGNDADSYLLLGNGEKLSLYDFKIGDYPLFDVDLLTLSACQTAVGGPNANGREIEGFGAMAQQSGAKSVLATLWSVADESTGLFMKTMYQQRVNQGLSKIEAIRQVQLAMLSGDLKGESGTERGFNRDAQTKTSATWPGYSHPFYWAPFILMGNWL